MIKKRLILFSINHGDTCLIMTHQALFHYTGPVSRHTFQIANIRFEYKQMNGIN